jgi:ligand-binding sensor domain-containing protein/serine phosphatase RsbU (regulator of sigma subunit)
MKSIGNISMRNLVLISFFFLLIFSCNKNNSTNEENGPALFPQPKSYSLNTKEGYKINPVTGDSVKPILNSLGDTLKTGVKIPAKGKIIHPDSVSKPKVVRAVTEPVEVNAHPNRHKIPKNLTAIKVNNDSLTKILLKEISKNDTSHYILNSINAKVKTGIKIPVIGKKVKIIKPKSTPALPLRMKDNAIANIQYLDVDQGMSSSYVQCVLEDKSGNLWFGTSGGGVSKYDGESFVHFTEKEGLSNNYVLSILEDKSGNLWFGTNGGGVSKYDGGSFSHFTEKEGLSNNIVWSILEDKSGNLWFGTYGGGVSKYDGESFVHFTEKEGLSNNYVWSILEDKSGNLWFGTNGGGVSKYDGESFVHFTEKEGLSNNIVWSILEDKSGNLWFGTSGGGVSKYDGESFVHFTEKEGLSNNYVRSILEDKSGNLWFGTYGGGVSKYDGESFVHFTEKEGLSNNIVWSILEDKSGNLWFGTYGGGVSKYDGESFVHFTEKEGLSNNYVWSILEDKSGNLWFGTNGGGVSKYDGESFVHFTEKEGLSNNIVWSILEDKSGNLWFGTSGGGVSKYDGESFVHFTEKEGLSNNIVWSILEDKSGNLWFGTSGGGVSKYDGESFVHFTEKEGLSNNIVWSILEDKSGNLWFGTYGGGVSKYDGESFVHFTEKEGLSNNIVWSILEDKSGNLWFGTNGGGVSKYDGESFVHFTEKEGLSNNIVWSILEDNSDSHRNGSIYLSTEKGISEIKSENLVENTDKNKSSNLKYTININIKQDGLKGLDFYANSAFIDSKNRAWWGSGKGLEMLDLNKFKISQKIPQPVLKQIDINENFIDYRNINDSLGNEIEFNGVQRFQNYPLNLELPYDKNHLTFHFSAIDWAAPHKIQYQYKMEGLDENWSNPNKETKVDYRNLPYGTYTFKVRAIGESQIWSKPFEYTFTIHPPWWHTKWFRVCYVSCFVLLLYLLFRWRTSSLRERQKQLEKTVEERTADVVAEKKEVEKQKEIVEEKHKEITDSINYAERIQRSFLASRELLDENLRDYFVFFKPKDVVSGDFYWASQLNNGNFMFTVADSTGHGVPGAIMSILNISSLEKSIETETEPHKVLNETRKIIINRLKKDGSAEGGKDGMDCSLLMLNQDKSQLTFASANNPIIVIRDGEVLEFKADKMPVGKNDRDQISFTLQTLQLQKGDLIYTLTDGFPDQFGGEKGKKFMIKNLKNLFLSISNLSMKEQEQKLNDEFTTWKGENEQVDDVCIIGIRV